jgi:hypothetical protein
MAAQLIPREGLQLSHTRPNNPIHTQPKRPPIQESSNPPPPCAVETIVPTDVETGPKLREHRGGQPLGEDVSELRSRRNVEDTNVPDGNALTDKLEINLNMLGAPVLNGVGGEIDSADVVAVDQSGLQQGVVQLHKQPTKPAHSATPLATARYSTSALEQEMTF